MHTAFRLAGIAGAAALSACSPSDKPFDAVCASTPCGYFDIAKTKESSPIFLAGATVATPYRVCVREGSVILQVVESEDVAQSIGGEILGGNCADMSFADRVYILGNTGSGRATGFYYRVP